MPKEKKKVKQIVIRFDEESYGKITERAVADHRGLGEYIRHITLSHIERLEELKGESTK